MFYHNRVSATPSLSIGTEKKDTCDRLHLLSHNRPSDVHSFLIELIFFFAFHSLPLEYAYGRLATELKTLWKYLLSPYDA